MGPEKLKLTLIASVLITLLMLFQNCSDGRLQVTRDLETVASFGNICSAFLGENLGVIQGIGGCRITHPQIDHDFDDVQDRLWFSSEPDGAGLNGVNAKKFCEFVFLAERATFVNATSGSGEVSTNYLEYNSDDEEWQVKPSDSGAGPFNLIESIDCQIQVQGG